MQVRSMVSCVNCIILIQSNVTYPLMNIPNFVLLNNQKVNR